MSHVFPLFRQCLNYLLFQHFPHCLYYFFLASLPYSMCQAMFHGSYCPPPSILYFLSPSPLLCLSFPLTQLSSLSSVHTTAPLCLHPDPYYCVQLSALYTLQSLVHCTVPQFWATCAYFRLSYCLQSPPAYSTLYTPFLNILSCPLYSIYSCTYCTMSYLLTLLSYR